MAFIEIPGSCVLEEIKTLLKLSSEYWTLPEKTFSIYERYQQLLAKIISSVSPSTSSLLGKSRVDKTAQCLIPWDYLSADQDENIQFKAIRATGNGNCLYNSCSLLLIGNEKLCHLLRALVSLELVLNHKFYHANHPFIEEKANYTEESMSTILEHAMSNYASENHSDKKKILVQAHLNLDNKAWSPFICILALSSVVSRKIQVVYPKTENIYEQIFNGTISPRIESAPAKSSLIIMFSMISSLEQFDGKFIANHFVPIFESAESSNIGQLDDFSNQHKRKDTQQPEIIKSKIPRIEEEGPATSALGKNPASKSSHKSKPKYRSIVEMLKPTIKPKSTKTKPAPSNEASNEAHQSTSQYPAQNPADHSETIADETVDIGLHFNTMSKLPDKEKLQLLNNLWKPGNNYTFPPSQYGLRSLSCNTSWFTKFQWLSYSPSLNKIFCICCLLFPSIGKKDSKLAKDGLNYWPSASGKLNNHQNKNDGHKLSCKKLEHFVATSKDQTKSVKVALNRVETERIKSNRAKLLPIIKYAIFLLKQSLPFRGHRDDSKHLLIAENNPGNFQALLKLASDFGDETLSSCLNDGPKNATYKSKTIQNQIINVVGDFLVSGIVKDIKSSKFYSILADEASDVSNKEQMALVIRYLGENFEIKENFIGFFDCNKGLSGEQLSKVVLSAVQKTGLSMDNCRGQGYDGAGAMAGSEKGVAKRITDKYPKALYIHCHSHILNLCVMKVVKITLVENMFDSCRVISDFFNNSPKRFQLFQQKMADSLSNSNTSSKQKLINICRTRWCERLAGLATFVDCYEVTHKCLGEIKDNVNFNNSVWNADSRTMAGGLFYGMKKFGFIVALVVCKEILAYTSDLTVSLQGKDQSIVEAYESISTVVATLNSIRVNNVDHYHEKWYNRAVRIAKGVNTVPAMPRINSIQFHRANTPADKVSDYYRRVVTIPMLDHVLNDLQERFGKENKSRVDAFYCIPSIMDKYFSWKKKFKRFVKDNADDLPNIGTASAEIDRWEHLWLKQDHDQLPSSVSDTLKKTMQEMYPNITEVLKILAVTPVTTCTCERSISALRRLKTYLRSTMGQERFSSVSLAHIHYGTKIDENEILNRLAVRYPKRLAMINVLRDDEELDEDVEIN